MDKIQNIENKGYLFGALLLVGNKMDTLLERVLKKHGITAKQWFMLLIINNLFEHPPTLVEVAKEMGSSHQNVKQVALKLEEKGMIRLVKDKRDKRITRIIITEKNNVLWKQLENDGNMFMDAFYFEIDKEIISSTKSCIEKILFNLNNIGKKCSICYQNGIEVAD